MFRSVWRELVSVPHEESGVVSGFFPDDFCVCALCTGGYNITHVSSCPCVHGGTDVEVHELKIFRKRTSTIGRWIGRQ